MTVKFKSRRKYYMFDSTSGYISELSKLEYEIFSYIDLPMTPLCPTSLRYELAKYDSEDVSSAYKMFLDLYTDKKIFSSTSNTDDVLCIASLDAFGELVAEDALRAFFDQASRRVVYKLSESPIRQLATRVAEECGMKVQ